MQASNNPYVSTWYGDIHEDLLARFKTIKLLVCDVDGVFSDGRIYLGNNGEELKAFHTRDGLGVKALLSAGIEVAVITGRTSTIVQSRMQALGVQHIYQGQHDKLMALREIQSQTGISLEQTASVGDDTPDLALFQGSQLAFSVFDGHPQVQQHAHYVTQQRGGFGAVREIADLLLLSQGLLHQVQESST
ncbi:3-deoxy-manno-octulosonate-8-phosphatase KdsC [Aliidiomarina shirensis]|uniref:3-deoxy-D-manno-octulosonate 8-phosphate phosphatase KdsC n=1 Tax=Aliidiomarina shirensis TaxID=1048642 RepID=A0A432WUX8_9GAMM|nr:3-deoxy-manno-octulosonate-8-phosphatase KdsC [Aliidiomarina shirensis]RUO37576.1 3-deoxy-manno-octulosonate-8-phosphatase KdsC [Aliidiomarina shirensis]